MIKLSNGKYIIGMRSDGSVVAMGENEIKAREVSNWKDIAAVSAGYDFIVGLKLDGTVVQVGGDWHEVSGWNDIAAIDAGISYTVGFSRFRRWRL